MRIGVVGAGGAGGHFAARWIEAGHDVTVVARGDHGRAISRDGLRLRSPLGDAHVHPRVVPNVSDFPQIDCAVFATKSFQLREAAAEASGLSDHVVAFGLQNGVTAADQLRRALPSTRVLGATCRVISLIESPGVIRHVGADPTITIGANDEAGAAASQELASALSVGGQLSVIASDRIDYEIWNKFLFFAPISGVGAVSDLTIGALRDDAHWRALLSDGMKEIVEIASRVGVDLGHDAVERTLAFVDIMPPDGTSSLHRDVRDGRPNELQDLSGRVVEMGRELGIETPAHAHIVEALMLTRCDPPTNEAGTG